MVDQLQKERIGINVPREDIIRKEQRAHDQATAKAPYQRGRVLYTSKLYLTLFLFQQNTMEQSHL